MVTELCLLVSSPMVLSLLSIFFGVGILSFLIQCLLLLVAILLLWSLVLMLFSFLVSLSSVLFLLYSVGCPLVLPVVRLPLGQGRDFPSIVQITLLVLA